MKLRRGLFGGLALLLTVLPLLGLWENTVAAATSRVAVIKSMTGTVQVRKSGGSKLFKAFAKMSLNEGDVLTTSANGSAVLQFANGTSEDDKMSVAAGTTLTFSKLSDRKGTRTKVSMFNGSAWIDVKSIASPNDEFTLETPTAIMGVRGTHLLVSVDPVTGESRLTVAAGVVRTQPSNSGASEYVKPGDNAFITKNFEGQGEIVVAPADLEKIVGRSDKSIVEAIVAASGEIVKENRTKLDQYFAGESETGVDELARKKSNVENLLGAIVDNAVKNGLITQERVNILVAEAEVQAGVPIDLSKKTMNYSEEDKRKQNEQAMKEQETLKVAEDQKRAAEEERKKNAEVNQKLEADRIQRENQNKIANEGKRKKALEEYERQLADAEKERFKSDQRRRELEQQSTAEGTVTSGSGSGTNPSTSPSTSPSPSPSEGQIEGITVHVKNESDEAVSWYPLGTGHYGITADADTLSVSVSWSTAFADAQFESLDGLTVDVSGAGSTKIFTINSLGDQLYAFNLRLADHEGGETVYTFHLLNGFVNSFNLYQGFTKVSYSYNAVTGHYSMTVPLQQAQVVLVPPLIPPLPQLQVKSVTRTGTHETMTKSCTSSEGPGYCLNLNEGLNSFDIDVADTGGVFTHRYTLDIRRELPAGIQELQPLNSSGAAYTLRQDMTGPADRVKRYFTIVASDASTFNLKLVTDGAAEVQNPSGAVSSYSSSRSLNTFALSSDTYQRFVIRSDLTGTPETSELVVVKGSVTAPLPADYRFAYDGISQDTLPVFNNEIAVYIASPSSSRFVNFSFPRDVGDVEITPSTGGLSITRNDDGTFTISGLVDGRNSFSIAIHDPTNYLNVESKFVTVHYGSIPASVTLITYKYPEDSIGGFAVWSDATIKLSNNTMNISGTATSLELKVTTGTGESVRAAYRVDENGAILGTVFGSGKIIVTDLTANENSYVRVIVQDASTLHYVPYLITIHRTVPST